MSDDYASRMMVRRTGRIVVMPAVAAMGKGRSRQEKGQDDRDTRMQGRLLSGLVTQ
jgi:hypothetical protein